MMSTWPGCKRCCCTPGLACKSVGTPTWEVMAMPSSVSPGRTLCFVPWIFGAGTGLGVGFGAGFGMGVGFTTGFGAGAGFTAGFGIGVGFTTDFGAGVAFTTGTGLPGA